MKYLLTFILSLIVCIGNTQFVTDVLVQLKKGYNPLFSKTSADLSINYLKSYEVGKSDTTYSLAIYIDKSEIETTSTTISAGLFSVSSLLGSSIDVSATYQKFESEGQILMNQTLLQDFYTCANDVYRSINEKKIYHKGELSTLITCNVESIRLGGELQKKKISGLSSEYYFQLGNEAIYKMDESEFVEIVQTLRDIKNRWGS